MGARLHLRPLAAHRAGGGVHVRRRRGRLGRHTDVHVARRARARRRRRLAGVLRGRQVHAHTRKRTYTDPHTTHSDTHTRHTQTHTPRTHTHHTQTHANANTPRTETHTPHTQRHIHHTPRHTNTPPITHRHHGRTLHTHNSHAHAHAHTGNVHSFSL